MLKTWSDIIRRRSSANAVNDIPQNAVTFSLFDNIGRHRFADVYLWMIFSTIFRGLKNVSFTNDYIADTQDKTVADSICEWFTINSETLIYYLWKYGYIVIDVHFDAAGNVHMDIPNYTKLTKDGKTGEIVGHRYVYYSQTYRYERRSDFSVIKNEVTAIDNYASGDEYLTETLGAFGILCGKNMPISELDKESFFERIKNKVGIRRDKIQIIPFNTEVDFKQIDLPIKDLALNEKIIEKVKTLAGYFGVPYDMLPIAGASTYANQEQATKNFYSNAISPLAEVLLDTIRYVVRSTKTLLIPSRSFTFIIDNVPDLVNNRPVDVEYLQSMTNLYKAMRDNGLNEQADELREQIQIVKT